MICLIPYSCHLPRNFLITRAIQIIYLSFMHTGISYIFFNNGNVCCVLFLVSRPYAMPELWGGEVPTSDSGQSSPRLWVPNPYSLSPTRQSKPAFQWQGTNERVHRQWQQGTKRMKDRHGGHQITYGSHSPRLWHDGPSSFSEQPGETITQQRENSLLRVGLNI